MVSFQGWSYADLLLRFRQLRPMQQAAVVGLIFFVIYVLYSYVLQHLDPIEALSMSAYSAIIFMVVYYFTSVIINRKGMQAASQSKGPKKGLRNK